MVSPTPIVLYLHCWANPPVMLQVSVAMSPGHSGPGSVRRPVKEGRKETTASTIISHSFPVSITMECMDGHNMLNPVQLTECFYLGHVASW